MHQMLHHSQKRRLCKYCDLLVYLLETQSDSQKVPFAQESFAGTSEWVAYLD